MNNQDSREKRIDHAREYLNEAIEQNTNVAIGAGGFAILLIVIFIYALCTEGTDLFTEGFVGLLLMALLLFLCGGLLRDCCITESRKYKRLMQDVEGNLEEIEKLEADAMKRIQKNKITTSPSGSRSITYHATGGNEHGWRKYIAHSEYDKYHINLDNYETEFQYEDALRKAKNHYDKMHD